MLDPISRIALIRQEKEAGLLGTTGKGLVKVLKTPGELMQKLAPKLNIPKPGFVGGVARVASKVMADKVTSHNILPGVAMGGMSMMSSSSMQDVDKGYGRMLDQTTRDAIVQQAYIDAGQEKEAGMLSSAGNFALKALKIPGQMIQKAAPAVAKFGETHGPAAPGFVGSVKSMARGAAKGIGSAMSNKVVAHGATAGALGAAGGYAIGNSRGQNNMNRKYAGLTRDEQLAIIEQAYQDAEMEKSAGAAGAVIDLGQKIPFKQRAGEVASTVKDTVIGWAKAPGHAVQRGGERLAASGRTAVTTAQGGGSLGAANPYAKIISGSDKPGVWGATRRGAGAAMQNKYVAHSVAPTGALAVGAGAYAATRKKKSSLTKEEQLAIVEMAYQDAEMEKSAATQTRGRNVMAPNYQSSPNSGGSVKNIPYAQGPRKAVNITKGSKSIWVKPGEAIAGAGKNLFRRGDAYSKGGKKVIDLGQSIPLGERAGNTARSVGGAVMKGVGSAMRNKYVAHGAIPTAVAATIGGGAYLATRKKKSSDEANIFADALLETNFHNALADEVYEWKEAHGLLAQ